MAKVRAHERGQDGRLYQLPFVVDEKGNQIPYPITVSGPVNETATRQKVARKGAPLIVLPSNNLTMANSRNGRRGGRAFTGRSAQLAQVPGTGVLKTTQLGTLNPVSTGKKLRVILTNGANGIWKNHIFDSATVNAETATVSNPAGATVGGSFGTKTLSILKLLTNGLPPGLVLGKMHLEASNEDVFSSLVMNIMQGDITGDTPKSTKVHFSDKVDGGTYSPKYRVFEDFQMAVNSLTSVYFEMPVSRTLTITWDILETAEAANFVPVGV